MARYNFSTERTYAAQLTRTAQRPIENSPNLSLALIRLEFTIYWMTTRTQVLESHGEIACRELVVGKLIPESRDSGLIAYAEPLGVALPTSEPANWLGLEKSSRWVQLQFGKPESEGERNPFRTIDAFNPSGWTIKKYPYDKNAEWVRIQAAADAVQVSESTVRRRVDALETEWGSRLIVRTAGGQRRIHLPLFTKVWQD